MHLYSKYASEAAAYCRQKIKEFKEDQDRDPNKVFSVHYNARHRDQVWIPWVYWKWRSTDMEPGCHILKGFVANTLEQVDLGDNRRVTSGSFKYNRTKNALVGTINTSKHYESLLKHSIRFKEEINADKATLFIQIHGRTKVYVTLSIELKNGFVDNTLVAQVEKRIENGIKVSLEKALKNCKGKLSRIDERIALNNGLAKTKVDIELSLNTYESIPNIPYTISFKKSVNHDEAKNRHEQANLDA